MIQLGLHSNKTSLPQTGSDPNVAGLLAPDLDGQQTLQKTKLEIRRY